MRLLPPHVSRESLPTLEPAVRIFFEHAVGSAVSDDVWLSASPRWCLEVVSRPGGLIIAGPNSLRRSSSCISNAVEPSEHCGAGMGDPHAVVHVKCSNQHARTSHFSLPHPAISAQSVQISAPMRLLSTVKAGN